MGMQAQVSTMVDLLSDHEIRLSETSHADWLTWKVQRTVGMGFLWGAKMR